MKKMVAAASLALLSLTAVACLPEERTLIGDESESTMRERQQQDEQGDGADAATNVLRQAGDAGVIVPCTPATCPGDAGDAAADAADAAADGATSTTDGGLAKTALVGERDDGFLDAFIVACHTRNGGASAAGAAADLGRGARVYPALIGAVSVWQQDFVGGSLGPSTCVRRADGRTASMLRGDIHRAYLVYGAASLGLPSGDEYMTAGGPRQDFERGYVAWDPSRNAYRVYPKL
jgi:uncharacterized protein with LGFP repeats